MGVEVEEAVSLAVGVVSRRGVAAAAAGRAGRGAAAATLRAGERDAAIGRGGGRAQPQLPLQLLLEFRGLLWMRTCGVMFSTRSGARAFYFLCFGPANAVVVGFKYQGSYLAEAKGSWPQSHANTRRRKNHHREVVYRQTVTRAKIDRC